MLVRDLGRNPVLLCSSGGTVGGTVPPGAKVCPRGDSIHQASHMALGYSGGSMGGGHHSYNCDGTDV